MLVHTTLGEKAPWDAAALATDDGAEHVGHPHLQALARTSCARKSVPSNVIEKLIGATLEELRAFKSAGGQVLFGTDVGYMHEYDPTDEYV